MAKKKAPSAATAPAPAVNGEGTGKESAPRRRDPSPEKVEKLKTLNNLLLKETVERREQLHQLDARIDELSFDHSFLAGAEREVRSLVLCSFLDELKRELAARELLVERKRRELEAILASAEAGKAEAEETVRCLSSRLGSTEEKLTRAHNRAEVVAREKSEVERALGVAVSVKNSTLRDLHLREKDLTNLSSKVGQLEEEKLELESNLLQLQLERDELAKQEEVMEEALNSLLLEKAVMQNTIEECRRSVANLENSLTAMEIEKTSEIESLKVENNATEAKLLALDAKHAHVVEQNHQLESELVSLRPTVELSKRREETLNLELSEMKQQHTKVSSELQGLQMEFGALVKEKEEAQLAFEAQKMEFVRELEHLGRRVKEIQQGKDLAESMKTQKEVEAVHLKDEVNELQSSIAELQGLCGGFAERNGLLQANKASIEKDLAIEKLEAGRLRTDIDELKRDGDVKDGKIVSLEAALNCKEEKMEGLNKELLRLQLLLAEEQAKKGGIWTWLYPATTTVFAAISLAYAARVHY